MDKQNSPPTSAIRDPKTGNFVSVVGLGAMKSEPIPLRKGIDLTKPISEQVLNKKLPESRSG